MLTDGTQSVVQLLKINFLAMFNKYKIFLSIFPEMFSFQPQVQQTKPQNSIPCNNLSNRISFMSDQSYIFRLRCSDEKKKKKTEKDNCKLISLNIILLTWLSYNYQRVYQKKKVALVLGVKQWWIGRMKSKILKMFHTLLKLQNTYQFFSFYVFKPSNESFFFFFTFSLLNKILKITWEIQ